MAEWRDVVGFEGCYQVSDAGEVKSVARVNTDRLGRPYPIEERILTPWCNRNRGNYLYVKLYRPDGPSKRAKVHRLVMEAFIGPCPADMEVCHNDGNPANNALANLRYATRSENMRDSLVHGTHPQASKTQCPQGHNYSEHGTRWAGGGRRCRLCEQDRVLRRKLARHAKALSGA